MFGASFSKQIEETLLDIREAGLYKEEHPIGGVQSARIQLADGREVLNMCANNYLGLASHPKVVEAARASLDQWGYGMASVRFICGTQSLHKQLEQAISDYLGKEDTILYAACFDANGGLFEPLLDERDAIISDQLNHASIIDGIRLCKAQRFRYANNNMEELENCLKAAKKQGCRNILVATDGVFSMDGIIADLGELTKLATAYEAVVMVDDCHATGFLGSTGRGSPEYCGVESRVDILTGTLGKALGGASGGYISGPKGVIDLLRQRSRPYLFSNTLAPPITAASLAVLELIQETSQFRDHLMSLTRRYREGLASIGLETRGEVHPIVPVMIGDARKSQEISTALMERGIYAVGFFYPVVPKGLARIRTQISAAHSEADIDFALDQWDWVAKNLL